MEAFPWWRNTVLHGPHSPHHECPCCFNSAIKGLMHKNEPSHADSSLKDPSSWKSSLLWKKISSICWLIWKLLLDQENNHGVPTSSNGCDSQSPTKGEACLLSIPLGMFLVAGTSLHHGSTESDSGPHSHRLQLLPSSGFLCWNMHDSCKLYFHYTHSCASFA